MPRTPGEDLWFEAAEAFAERGFRVRVATCVGQRDANVQLMGAISGGRLCFVSCAFRVCSMVGGGHVLSAHLGYHCDRP